MSAKDMLATCAKYSISEGRRSSEIQDLADRCWVRENDFLIQAFIHHI